MENSRIFVFRIDYQYENDFIQQELRAGRLRQGWGPVPLRSENTASEATPEEFVKRAQAAWPGASEEEVRGRYRILSPMLDMKAGDLIVIPKFPDPYGRSFAIVEAIGGYRFDSTPFDDYGHCIPINPNTIREIGYDEGFDAKRISGKFTSYRSAINNVWHEGFIEAAYNLWRDVPIQISPAQEWSAEVQGRALTHVESLLADLPPHAIESLVTRAFEYAGYEVKQRHHFDGRGGDADIVFSVHLPLLSEVQGVDLKLFVQVKKRNGEDPNDLQGLDQLERIAADEPMALKVLFTTASCISEEAARVAHEKGIALIGGDTATAFLARGLLTPTTA